MSFNFDSIKEEMMDFALRLRQAFNDAQVGYYIPESEEPQLDLNVPSIRMEGKPRDGRSTWFVLHYNPQTQVGRGSVMHVDSADMSFPVYEFHGVEAKGFHTFIGALKDDYLISKWDRGTA